MSFVYPAGLWALLGLALLLAALYLYNKPFQEPNA